MFKIALSWTLVRVMTRRCAGDIPLCHAGCLICIYLSYFSADTGASQSTSADNILKAKGFSTHESWLFVYIFLMKLITPVRARFFDAMVERDGADSEAGNMKIDTTTASLSS